MSQVKIAPTDKISKKDFLSYIGSLGASHSSAVPSDPSSDYAFDIITQSELHRHHVITEVCRKLDTMNVEYEVIK
jgi:hypothetical protein|tara:strand:+ start:3466 stop:3690 length:225 start_codon:yes stop_codon:yes gene_type:complete